MTLTNAELLGGTVKQAHGLLNVVFEDVTDELANRPAPGLANPLGTAYAHVVFSEDAFVNAILKGTQPLSAGEFAPKTGVDQPMPLPGFVAGDMGEWFKTAKVQVEPLRAYAGAVFRATEQYVDEADDATLERPVDLSFAGLGTKPLALALAQFVVEHADNFSGEISAIKGVFGLKGYPF